MNYLTEDLTRTIKTAREAKGISQRELSHRIGVPQSYISKVENGLVDIGLSSLIAFSRALDLEVKLVPRRAVPAVESVVESVSPSLYVSKSNISRWENEFSSLADNSTEKYYHTSDSQISSSKSNSMKRYDETWDSSLSSFSNDKDQNYYNTWDNSSSSLLNDAKDYKNSSENEFHSFKNNSLKGYESSRADELPSYYTLGSSTNSHLQRHMDEARLSADLIKKTTSLDPAFMTALKNVVSSHKGSMEEIIAITKALANANGTPISESVIKNWIMSKRSNQPKYSLDDGDNE